MSSPVGEVLFLWCAALMLSAHQMGFIALSITADENAKMSMAGCCPCCCRPVAPYITRGASQEIEITGATIFVNPFKDEIEAEAKAEEEKVLRRRAFLA